MQEQGADARGGRKTSGAVAAVPLSAYETAGRADPSGRRSGASAATNFGGAPGNGSGVRLLESQSEGKRPSDSVSCTCWTWRGRVLDMPSSSRRGRPGETHRAPAAQPERRTPERDRQLRQERGSGRA